MTATLIIVITTFVLLTSSILFIPSVKVGKVKLGTYWMVAFLGAAILLCTKLLPIGTLWRSFTANTSVNPLKILLLFFSMTFISVVLDELGLFRFLANKAVRLAGKTQLTYFVVLYFLTAALTVFTSNDVVILTLTPFICFFCKNANIDPIPYLLGEFAAANTWSMMLVIGNPTNIYLASFSGIEFLEYLRVMILPTIAAGAVQFVIILLLFYKKFRTEPVVTSEDITIGNKFGLTVGLIHLGVCLLFLVISGYLKLEMWLISSICALSLLIWLLVFRLLIRKDERLLVESVKRLPWQLIPFVLSMFVIVITLQHQGISDKIGRFLGEKYAIWTYGLSSYVSANLINNIPMSIFFATVSSPLAEPIRLQAVYASIVGSNIGAFLTPIGALAGIMFTELTGRYNVKYGFSEFIRYGSIVSLPTIGAALAVLLLIL